MRGGVVEAMAAEMAVKQIVFVLFDGSSSARLPGLSSPRCASFD